MPHWLVGQCASCRAFATLRLGGLKHPLGNGSADVTVFFVVASSSLALPSKSPWPLFWSLFAVLIGAAASDEAACSCALN
jgi:hypothetical protein